MTKIRFTNENIAGVQRDNGGRVYTAIVCHAHQISPVTSYLPKAKNAGFKGDLKEDFLCVALLGVDWLM